MVDELPRPDLKFGQAALMENEKTEVEVVSSGGPSAQTRTKSTREKVLQISLLLLAIFVIVTAYSVIAPFFPQQATRVGMTETEVGLVFALFPTIVFIMSPIYGYYIVKMGPKFQVVSGCFLCGGSCILFGLLGQVNNRNTLLGMTLLCRAVEGNGSAMLNVAAASLVMKSFPGKTGLMSSLIEAAIGLGFIAGPALGSAFYAIGGFILPFIVIGGLAMLASLLLLIVLDKSDDVDPQPQNFLRMFRIPGIFVMFLQFVVSSLVMTFLDPVFGTWLENLLGVTPSIVGLTFSSWSLSYVIVTPLIGKVVDKGYVFSTMIIGVFSSGIAFMFLAPSPLLDSIFPGTTSLWIVVVVCLIQGICNGALYVPGYQATLNTAEVNGYELNVQTYALTSGIMNSGYSLGSAVGPLLSGYLTETYSFAWATTIMTFTLVSMGFIDVIYVCAMKWAGKPLALNNNESEHEDSAGTELHPVNQ
ncbi:MFS-type transporter SLC18B1-like [Watersipora subatra]|uniref:MFS-type transporter SLC18B1-like n=1 Tax=Watersipora subatra TaxID=2589382 RepID=UPI00355B15B2